MSQILWLWSLLPASLVAALINLLIVVGVVGVCASWIAKWIPFFNVYQKPIKIVGIILLVLGVFFKGGESVEKIWRARVADLEEKVAAAEKAAAEANGKIETVFVDRVVVVKEKQVVIKNRIRSAAKKMDQVCTIESDVISILNDAAITPAKGSKK